MWFSMQENDDFVEEVLGSGENSVLMPDGGRREDKDSERSREDVPEHRGKVKEAETELNKELRALRDEHLEVLDDLRVKHRELKAAHLEELDYLMGRYENILEKRDIAEELREDYEEVLEDHIGLLEDLADEENQGIFSKLGLGTAGIAAGLVSAELYLPTEDIVEFYQQSPDIYMDNPEIGFVTLGLPLAGLYSFGKAFDHWNNYRDLKDELSEYRAKKEEL
jgi:hypothetical protein